MLAAPPDVADAAPAFEDEAVDADWAEAKAGEISELVDVALAVEQLTAAVRATPVTCRSTMCRFELQARTPERLVDAVAVLEDERGGLQGRARTMVLSNLRGSSVTVTLQFDPREPEAPAPE